MSSENLWAPWRMQYLSKLDPEKGIDEQGDKPSCFICDATGYQADSKEGNDRLVLLNDDRGIIMLNRFPYSNGHLLIAAKDHIGDLTELSREQRNHLMHLTALAEDTIKLAYNPQGFNVGINIGRSAGAGLPGHLHVHVMPRWAGDTNFITTIGNVRVLPQALEESYKLLVDAISKVRGNYD